jgi:hypothetical protein
VIGVSRPAGPAARRHHAAMSPARSMIAERPRRAAFAWYLVVLHVSPSVAFSFPSVDLDPAWPAAGVTIAARMAPPGTAQALPDGAGGVLFAWHEARKTDPASCQCKNTDDLYAQRLDASGRSLWSRTGVAVVEWGGIWGGADSLVAAARLADGDLVALWHHGDGPSGTFARRFAPDGTLRWAGEAATVYDRYLGTKWTARSSPHGGGAIWLGLDGDRETSLRVGRCEIRSMGPVCASPVVVPLPGQHLALHLLPGAAPDRALIATAVTSRGRTRVLAIPVTAGPGGRPVPKPAVTLADVAAPRIELGAEPDGAGGAVLGWIQPSGTGFEARLRAVDGRGRTRWARDGVRVPGPGGLLAAATDGAGGGVLFRQEARDGPLVIERMDARGRPADRRVTTGPARAERLALVHPAPDGPLLAWVESDGGDAETLRVARLVSAPGASATLIEGLPILRRAGAALRPDRLLPTAPGRAVLVVHDGQGGALRAFGLRWSATPGASAPPPSPPGGAAAPRGPAGR